MFLPGSSSTQPRRIRSSHALWMPRRRRKQIPQSSRRSLIIANLAENFNTSAAEANPSDGQSIEGPSRSAVQVRNCGDFLARGLFEPLLIVKPFRPLPDRLQTSRVSSRTGSASGGGCPSGRSGSFLAWIQMWLMSAILLSKEGFLPKGFVPP